MTEVFTWPVGRAAEKEMLDRRRGTPLRLVLTYVAFATLGGAMTGLALAATGSWLRGLAAGAGALLLVPAAALVLASIRLELQGRISPLPQRRLQVPRRWITWRHPSVTATAYGLVIGSGALTYLRHATAYALLALLLVMPSPVEGLLVGALYGLTRGSTVLASWLAARVAGREIRWERLIEKQQLVARGLAGASALALAAVVAVEVSWP